MKKTTLITIGIFFLYVIILNLIRRNEECEIVVNTQIKKIEKKSNMKYELYGDDGLIDIGFYFYDYDRKRIKVGYFLEKPKCSDTIYFFEKDSMGRKELKYKQWQRSNIIPTSWFCD